jgi:hypothetical protein
MANATADIQLGGIGQDGRRQHLPVDGGSTIYAGTMVAQLTATGMLVPATTAASGRVIGKATHQADNSTGTDGAVRCLVESDRIYRLTNGSSTNAFSEASQIGAPAYAADDHTVYDNSNGDTLKFAGYFQGMEADGKVRVLIPLFDATAVDQATGDGVNSFRVRNIVNGNIADLAAYTVASDAARNDATLNVEGDLVLLVAQSTAAQNGLYTVGTVAAGTAPLTRHWGMFTGHIFEKDDFEFVVGEGTVFAHSKWFNSAAGTIGTNDPACFPESVTISQALVAGTATITSIPVLSVTKTGFTLTRRVANTSTLTVGGYCVSTGGANGVTAGALGTASVVIEACVAAGTINAADISTLNITVTNR